MQKGDRKRDAKTVGRARTVAYPDGDASSAVMSA